MHSLLQQWIVEVCSQLYTAPVLFPRALVLLEMELRLLRRPIHSLGTIVTELSRFHCFLLFKQHCASLTGCSLHATEGLARNAPSHVTCSFSPQGSGAMLEIKCAAAELS
jgi:hypothetical protein